MNAARSRKTRSSSVRGGRGKGAEKQVLPDGVYTNHRFMQSVGALVGLPVRIQTKTNDVIEGVFTTFGPNFDLVLDLAHPVSRGDDPALINPETIKRKMIFTAADIVTIKVANVDLEYATREGFQVDQVISRFNGQVVERTLEPWQGETATEDSLVLEDSSSRPQNGWDVDDMFRKNEEKYGVTTSYTPDMEGYTTPLNKKNTAEYREREEKASRIAAEILKSPSSNAQSELENGDEEDKYSAVVRPGEQAAGGMAGGKYIPPMLRNKSKNGGKLQRSTPPPAGARYNSHPGPNPPASASPSYQGPPQAGSASHSPVGGLVGGSQAYPPQQQQTANPAGHSPSPAAHPPLHRNNSQGAHHGHTPETKVNGDAKGSYDRRSHEGSISESNREPRHNNNNNKQDGPHNRPHHGQAHADGQQQKPAQQKQQPGQHTGHMPPVGQGDHRKAEPREQREPRKQHRVKEEQLADLRKFSEEFKLTEPAEKKPQVHHQPQPQPPQPQQQQQQPPQQQQQQQQPPPQPQQPPPQQPPPQQPPPQLPQQQQQQPPPPPPQQQQPQQQQQQQQQHHPQHQQQHHQQQQQHHQQQQPQQQQPPPPQQQQQQPPPPQQQQQQPPPMPPQQHLPPQHMPPQQRQTPPVSAPVPPPPQSSHHPPTMTAADLNKPHEDVDKITSAVSHSKLNPNAKEFVFNPNAKPFSPRSPSTTTPPRPHTPQTPQIPSNQPQQMGAPAVGIPQTVVMSSQSFAVQPQPPRFPKRDYRPWMSIPVGNSQRPEYTSPMQVAAATGQPILAPAPMNTQPQAITTVHIPQNMLPQTPQHYQQYPSVPMMLRFPHAGMPVMAAMVPTSMGICHQNPDSQQQSQQHGHQTMYMAQAALPPHQPHPAHTPGPVPQPAQPPTPQNPGGGGGPPNMPNPPSTPGPSPAQPLIYPHMGAQPSLSQHMPQHSPHTAQSPHAPQYPGPGQSAAGTAGGGHHGGPGQQMATQFVVVPPHMMHHAGPPPHSATAHIPSSMAGFTPTSTAAVQHLQSGHHIPYFPKHHPRFAH